METKTIITSLGLIPIQNFAVVDDSLGLSRSAQPHYNYEYQWLKDVAKIDLIINLRSESRHDDYFAPKHGMEVVNVDVADHCEPTIEQAQNFMEIIRNCVAENKRVLFHCEHGHGRTSTFCVLARIALGWTLQEALEEEANVYHYHFRHHAQVEFLQNNFSNNLN
jgi:protein-tyrosine phosphatase